MWKVIKMPGKEEEEGNFVSPGIRIKNGAPELHGLRKAPSGPN